MVFFNIIYLLLFGCTYSQSVSEICRNYQAFTSPHERLVGNTQLSLRDEFIKEDWYGIKNFIIPFNPPGTSHCGAFFPIYLLEKPSTAGYIENTTACAQGANGCEFEINVPVLYCSPSLTVYKLSRVPSNYAAYCLSSSGDSEIPNFKTTPHIWYKLQDKGAFQQNYEIACGFSNPRNPALVYKTEWFVNSKSVYESNFTDYEDGDKERALTDTRLNDTGITAVGFQFYCEVTAGFRSNHVAGLPSRSKSRFIGIEVNDSIVNVNEGDVATVLIRPTWMVGCNSKLQEGNCNLTVTVVTPKESNKCLPSTKVTGGCGIKINPKYWYQWQPITVSPDVTLDREVRTITQEIYFSTNQHHVVHPMWGSYQLPPTKIVISKNTSIIEGRSCSMAQDPYLQDFKNRYMRFDLEGVFILYKSGIVEIQVQVTRCGQGKSGYCVCGAIVRVGRTAFMINSCNSNYWFIDYILCDDGGDIFDVKKQAESHFEISLPSGTKTRLHLYQSPHYHWMGIYIFPSVRDYEKTSGLCNNLNANTSLSWPARETLPTDQDYFNRWELTPSNTSNLFVLENLKYAKALEASGTYQYCNCDTEKGFNEEISCKPTPTTKECIIDVDYKTFHKKKCISPSRKKRSIPSFKKSGTQNRQKRDVSWENGWTENSAVEYCNGVFNDSEAIEHCSGVKGLNIGGAVQSCITDIQLSGSDEFALSSISGVSSQCLSEARLNKTLREVNVKDNKSILELVEEVTCPEQCSGHGRCDRGKCICVAGYIGSGCSVPLNEPPVAHSLDGPCDLPEEACTKVAVFGGSFVDHNQTKCKLVPFKMKNNQMIVSEDTYYITTAMFETIGEVTCELPSKQPDVPVIDEGVTGYKVSVSNNGQNYSQQLDFIIYNTDCMNCTADGMACSISTNHCIMDSVCYSHGSMYTVGDKEYMCRADSSVKDWLPIPEQCRSTNSLYLPFTNVNDRLVTNGQSGLSDRFFKEGWYGIKDYIIPSSPPGLFHCGAIFPIYLKESPVSTGNIENITACIQGNTVCEFEIQIQALVCPSLTVYNLLRPSLDSAAYCLEKDTIEDT